MLRGIVAGAGVLGCAAAAFVLNSEREKPREARTPWTADIQPFQPVSPTSHWDSNWDRRDPHYCVRPTENPSNEEKSRYDRELEEAKPTASRYLYLVRHGHFYRPGASDKEHVLTELGRKQADLTGQRLKQLKIPFTRLVHSTMTRATETAEIIHKHLEPLPKESCELIREGAPVPPDPPSETWNPDPKSYFVDGARIEAGFRKYFYRAPASQQEDTHEIIVCHSNVIRYWTCRALQLPPEAWLRISLAHGSVSVVKISPSGEVRLRALGDVGHLPIDMITAGYPR
ncbi:serine/threonine-protein phosphatase Pgam5, mitochondrial-like [Amblyomma americanum]